MRDVTVYLASDLHPSEHVVLQPDFDSCEFDLSAALSQLAALREELAQRDSFESLYNAAIDERDVVQQRLADAERRNKSIAGKITECRECGSNDLFWHTHSTSASGVQEGRLRSLEVECIFVLGCNDCSETLATVSADKIAVLMTAALNKPEEAKS